MTALVRFVRRGLDDVDRRLGRLTAPAAGDDRLVVDIVTSSRLFVWAEAATRLLSRAAGSSAVLKRFRAVQEHAADVPPAMRRRAAGLTLIVASLTIVGLNVASEPLPGWLWLVVPAAALLVGVVLVLASRPREGAEP